MTNWGSLLNVLYAVGLALLSVIVLIYKLSIATNDLMGLNIVVWLGALFEYLVLFGCYAAYRASKEPRQSNETDWDQLA